MLLVWLKHYFIRTAKYMHKMSELLQWVPLVAIMGSFGCYHGFLWLLPWVPLVAIMGSFGCYHGFLLVAIMGSFWLLGCLLYGVCRKQLNSCGVADSICTWHLMNRGLSKHGFKNHMYGKGNEPC